MIRSILISGLIISLYSSCTMILSTNVPGKQEKTLPKEWLGKYEVVSATHFSDKRDSVPSEKEYAIIESTRITYKGTDETKIFSLDDSLKYSVIYGQSRYLSLLMPQGLYAIFKVVKNADTLVLYSLSSDNEEIKKADLTKYFQDVEKIKRQDDEYYRVSIVEKKLDPYFKSPIPSKEPIKLVMVK